MTDGMSKSVVMLLGACVSERKQGAEIQRARILTNSSDRRVSICRPGPLSGYSVSTTPRGSVGLKVVSSSGVFNCPSWLTVDPQSTCTQKKVKIVDAC